MALLRTLLFAPGNHARKVEKSFTLGADGVILDLEDAVAIAEKEATRDKVVGALQPPRRCLGYVRVNAFDTPFCYGDLMAVVRPGLDGIVLPKVESASQLQTVDWLVTQLERERGMQPGSVDIIPIIETGRGMTALKAIVGCGSRVRRLSFGAGDYTLDMGMQWTLEERELDHARANVVLASRAGGLEPPLDTVFIHIGQIDGLRQSTRLARNLGFQGKLC
ncbi:MAG: CoA ester lyase, partial [Gammaproteobacteria bacterium]|nr:CoA ester lyase [Gammaproteobacteria bacterium]